MTNRPTSHRATRRRRVQSFLPHALHPFQRVLDLVNATPQELEKHPHELISYGPKKSAKRILEADCTLAGKPYVDITTRMESIRQIQAGIRRILNRYIDKAPDPLRDPKRPRFNPRTRRMDPLLGDKDFIVRGRTPLENVPAFFDEIDGRSYPDVRDLQDFWYVQVVQLLAGLRRRKPLVFGKGARQLRIPFRPLGRCDIWRKVPLKRRAEDGHRDRVVCERFYFPVRRNQATCGRRQCIERHKYLARRSS